MPSDAFLTRSVLQDALVFAAAALVVALLDRRERRRVVRVVLLGALGFAVHFAAHVASDSGTRGAAALELTGRAIAAIAAVALFGTLLFDVLLPLVKMRPPRILRDLAIAAGSIAATLAVLSSGKVEVVGIVATSAVLTAVLGWALQDTLSNVMGGLALQLDGSLKAGDWVTFGDTTGLVREVGWRQTTLETRNRDFLVVPNSLFMKTAVTLRGKGAASDLPRERRWIRFRVESGAAPSAVVACAQEALWRRPGRGRRRRAGARLRLPGVRRQRVELRGAVLADRHVPRGRDGLGREDAALVRAAPRGASDLLPRPAGPPDARRRGRARAARRGRRARRV